MKQLSAPIRAAVGHNYHPDLEALSGLNLSGVYVILDAAKGDVLYVGESHTGRLYDTITRHFRKWKVDPNDGSGRRRGGTTYNRYNVLVAWMTCKNEDAQDEQYRIIDELKPRDNTLDCKTCDIPI